MFNKAIIVSLGCLLFIGVGLAVAQTMHPGWPQFVGAYAGTVQKQGVVVYEDSTEGWLVGAARYNQIAVFRLNGEILNGWPQNLPSFPMDDRFCSGISMGDIDGDGSPEVVCCSRDFGFTFSILYVWHLNGELDSLLSRALLPPIFVKSPTLADLDSDGSYELLYVSDSLHALEPTGGEYPGFPVDWGDDPLSWSGGVVVGDINGNNIPDIVGTTRNLLHAQELGGREELPGWPVAIHDDSYNSGPIMVPTDSGTYIAMTLDEPGSNNFIVYLWNQRGELNQPWPLHINSWCTDYISAGDVDGDGEPELIFTSGETDLYAYKLDGSICRGFPHQYGNGASGGEVSVWRTNESQLAWFSFVVYDQSSYVYLTHPINVEPGFPVSIAGRGFSETTAIIPPQNDTLMIVYATRSGAVAVWDVPCSAPEFTIEWQMGSANPQRNAVYQPITITSLPLGITLNPHNPPIMIAAGGGSFNYDAEVYNMTDSALVFDIWTEVILPNNQIHGPLLLRRHITLPAGASVGRQLTQFVPSYAPYGGYSYVGNVGIYPDSVTDSDEFMFVKLFDDSPSNHYQGWSVYGWDEAPEVSILNSQFLILNSSPNPFNASTDLSFKLQVASNIKLAVYDVSGREVAKLAEGWYNAGIHRAEFNGKEFSSGMYFIKLEAGEMVNVKKVVLLK